MDILAYFKTMVEIEASDLYLTVARPLMYRVDGQIRSMGDQSFAPNDLEDLAQSVMNERQREEFKQSHEMNMAMSLPGVSRFRVNIFRQRGSVGMVIRRVRQIHDSGSDGGSPQFK